MVAISRFSRFKKTKAKATAKKWKSSVPSRLRVSKSRYLVTKQVSKAMANYGENKFCGYRLSCARPVAKPNGTQPLSYMFYNAGDLITSLPEFSPMNLFSFPQGDTQYQRNGQYMYLRKSQITLEIQMLPITETEPSAQAVQPEVDFRFMVVKANRKYDKIFKSKDPGNSLFLTPFNNEYGYDAVGESVFENQNAIINKKNWLVSRDSKFSLAVPVLDYSSTPSTTNMVNNAYSKLPTKKLIKLNIPVWKKTHFVNSTTDTENVPDNLDTQTMIIIQAANRSHCYENTKAPMNWRLNMVGTTTARDS